MECQIFIYVFDVVISHLTPDISLLHIFYTFSSSHAFQLRGFMFALIQIICIAVTQNIIFFLYLFSLTCIRNSLWIIFGLKWNDLQKRTTEIENLPQKKYRLFRKNMFFNQFTSIVLGSYNTDLSC